MNDRILVTGGSGFVGRAVLHRLLETHRSPVVAAVRDAKRNFSGDLLVKVVGELGPDTDWMHCLKGVDVVIHCAGRAHVMNEKLAHPLAEYRKVNTLGTLALGRQAIQAGVRRFVFVSSIKVNGDLTLPTQRFRADDVPSPKDAYGLSKLEAEQGLMSLALASGMEVVIIRPPLVYGPGVKGNFATLINWLQRGIPMPLGAINNQRSFLALDNLTAFIALCADREKSPQAANEVFLVCDGEEISTAELLRRIQRAYGVRIPLIPMPVQWIRTVAKLMGKGDVLGRLLDSLVIDASKAQNLLGWVPVTSIDAQLEKMAQNDTHA